MRVVGLVLAVLLAIGVVVAIGVSVAPRFLPTPAQTVTVHGVIGSEKDPFFHDPQVQAVFHRNGLDVQVDTAGSREIATTVDLSRYDFAFPAGVPAAQKIKADKKAARKVLDERFALMKEVFQKAPLALNVAYISWGEDALWARLGWERPGPGHRRRI